MTKSKHIYDFYKTIKTHKCRRFIIEKKWLFEATIFFVFSDLQIEIIKYCLDIFQLIHQILA